MRNYVPKFATGDGLEGDVLALLPMLESVAKSNEASAEGDPLDNLFHSVSAHSFGRIAIKAIEQNVGYIRQGELNQLRFQAQNIAVSATVEAAYVQGFADCLRRLYSSGTVSNVMALELMNELESHETSKWRLAARFAANILHKIENRRTRKRRPGRPTKGNEDFNPRTLLDSEILKQASDCVECGLSDGRNIDEQIPVSVREYVRLG